jgi:hypothetical protein
MEIYETLLTFDDDKIGLLADKVVSKYKQQSNKMINEDIRKLSDLGSSEQVLILRLFLCILASENENIYEYMSGVIKKLVVQRNYRGVTETVLIVMPTLIIIESLIIKTNICIKRKEDGKLRIDFDFKHNENLSVLSNLFEVFTKILSIPSGIVEKITNIKKTHIGKGEFYVEFFENKKE